MKWPATVIKARANPWPCLEISGLFLFVWIILLKYTQNYIV
jgi:hypothetical protein